MENYKIIYLEFLDHVKNHNKPLPCQVSGFLIEETETYFHVASWICDKDPSDDENTERFIILKSTVSKKRFFKV